MFECRLCGCRHLPVEINHLQKINGALLEALENLENDDDHMPQSAWKMVKDAIAQAKGEET